jgi:hypothetical protein
MNTLYVLGAILALALGVAHSYLGERYILIRLFRHEEHLPTLFGGTRFTRRTLRFAWHLTSVAWWGLGAILLVLAAPVFNADLIAFVVGLVFLVSAAITGIASRGRHLAWPVFLIIGLIAWYA